ncbi:multidrug resistance pump, putative [Ricinus communis]|uniref:ribonuclease P n=1 Tax=Ricinus communis TaxID=3988 RepID=B9SST8_RICCO|nr:multidrug resistance pump, putative [Ricinus communis]|eukprot:XP_002529057.1 proteinaceous RNase P 2 [Ricinus communis]
MATGTTTTAPVGKKKPNKKNQTPESQFNYNLNFYSKSKDLNSAISLYKTAISNKTQLNQHHYNTLLYLCSISLNDPSEKELALQNGFDIFEHMVATGIKRNEASITAIARLAAAKGDGDYAFNLIKNMLVDNQLPRLRTYDPVLFCFCEKLEAFKAYEVEDHIVSMGMNLEELEIAALLKVSVETKNKERVYGYLQKLRKTVRCVKEETAKIVEDWFKDFEVNGKELDVGLVRKAVVKNGGGWHGLGWIEKGKWGVKRGNMDMDGRCCCCGESLACVDIDDLETERFAGSLAGLAMEREVKANFSEFQDWLDKNADYDAIVDGANVGLYQQNFAEGGFSISQLDAVVKELYDRSGKWPLIVLHNKRVRAILENPSQRNLIQEWTEKDILYTTPHGSNDDWYWLYAAVKLKCLLVTNDEMRDHIFELLGSSFFLKWKERHQVRYTFVKGKLKLQMPPPFSVLIQESEKGSWHVPIAGDGNEDSAQSWLCITRSSACYAPDKDEMNIETFETEYQDRILLSPSKANSITGYNDILDSEESFPHSENKPATPTGKRKGRSTSPS